MGFSERGALKKEQNSNSEEQYFRVYRNLCGNVFQNNHFGGSCFKKLAFKNGTVSRNVLICTETPTTNQNAAVTMCSGDVILP